MKEIKYLTDEELDALILNVEEKEMIMAPPDMLENILARTPNVIDMNERRTAFRKYCVRVISSAAAAIVFVFMMPGLLHLQEAEIPSKETVVVSRDVKSKEEVIDSGSEGILRTIGNSRIISDGQLFHIFE